MASKVDLTLLSGANPRSDDLRCNIVVHDPELLGKDAEVHVIVHVEVKDKRPVHDEKIVFRKHLKVTRETSFSFPRSKIRASTYSGSKINIELHVRLEVDDGLLFDTKITEEQSLELGLKAPVATDAHGLIEPDDRFNFFANLNAIPARNQVVVLALAVIGAIIMAVNAIVGIHDQFVPESMTWLYSHYDSDGEASSPLVTSLVGSGVVGAGVWYLMRKQLQKYMTFRLRGVPRRVTPESAPDIESLIAGRARVPLHNVTLRVVAANMEKGQYVRGSGSNRRTVSFSEPARAVLLFEQSVRRIDPGQPIQKYFSGPVAFERMFRVLYPPLMVTDSHGLEVHWEVQLLHPKFVDHELIGPTKPFHFEDFLRS